MHANIRHPTAQSPQWTQIVHVPTGSGEDWYNVQRWRASQKVLLPLPCSFEKFKARMPVPNFSRVLVAKASSIDGGDNTHIHPALRRTSSKAQGIKRWNGQTRTYSDWDGLRRVSAF